MSEGGTETLDPTALDAKKDELGMSFNIGLGSTSSGASLWSLARNFQESFALAMDMLMRPGLDAKRLDVIRLGKAQTGRDRFRRRFELLRDFSHHRPRDATERQ